MPIAAVPEYLGKDFSDASPGMRFGMYLAIWTNREDQEKEIQKRARAESKEGKAIAQLLKQNGMETTRQCLTDEEYCREQRIKPIPRLWAKNDFAARQAWGNIVKLTIADKICLQEIATRQSVLAANTPNLLRLDAQAITPFTTGLGNEHPLENGFAFLNPYGLPYLPGSGVKGVVRRAAQELAQGLWEQDLGWKGLDQPRYRIEYGSGKKRVTLWLSVLDVLFGREPPPGDSNAVRGALAFWDVIPQINDNSLMVEIMTPHQSHYYQQRRDRKSGDSVSPHDSGQPNPIAFLTVPPGSRFTFHVLCDRAHLARLAPDLLDDDANGKPRWQGLIAAAFEHAFEWLGFGAKTAVGYGAMKNVKPSNQAEARTHAEVKHQAAGGQAPAHSQPPAEPEMWQGARIKFNRANKTLTVEKNGRSAHALAPKGEELLATLSPETRKKVESNLFVKVTAYVCGSTLVRLE